MSTKTKAIIAAVALLTAFASGRWLAPTKVVTEIKTVEVERKETDEEKKKHQTIIITETKHPDGTVTKVTKIVNNTKETKHETDDTRKETDDKKIVERSQSSLHLSALGGVQLSNGIPNMVYGGHISKEIIGPISIGIFGFTNSTFGASIGLSF